MAAGSFRTKSRIKRLQRWCAVSGRFFALFAPARIPAKTLRHHVRFDPLCGSAVASARRSVDKLAASNDDLAIAWCPADRSHSFSLHSAVDEHFALCGSLAMEPDNPSDNTGEHLL
jgi:hypothetical protein